MLWCTFKFEIKNLRNAYHFSNKLFNGKYIISVPTRRLRGDGLRPSRQVMNLLVPRALRYCMLHALTFCSHLSPMISRYFWPATVMRCLVSCERQQWCLLKCTSPVMPSYRHLLCTSTVMPSYHLLCSSTVMPPYRLVWTSTVMPP